ncbi:LysR family transcriptional regulator [Desulfosporosinus sp. BG]|uniref:LysR family transcriptional regulator n=1 Tax=Desulfosporosinus sp. BG TaxID=1633135 RepID=UPI00083A781F|nr:LysR family transcriptional regulator [Desulfosporosinus sp. BG]ODA42979.1 LysR family regulatory protein CidR [Desulfosporosinus sp. BG]
MDIRHLEYFVEVARQKSFSSAAKATHVTQSTISKMIKDMETELGKALFNRSSKYVQLTDTGEMLFPKAKQIVEMFLSIPTELDIMAKTEKGKLSIGLPPITAATAFAQLLGEFIKAYPNIEINLFEYGSKRVELGIQDGSLDVGLICCPANSDQYNIMHFSKDPLWVVGHSEHPLREYPKIEFELLVEEIFVLYRRDFSLYDEIVKRCKMAGFQPKVAFETSQLELMTQIVAAKLGIALLPSKLCAELDPKTMAFMPLSDPQIFLELSLIWHKRRYLSYATHLLVEFIQASLLEKIHNINESNEFNEFNPLDLK